MKSAAVKTIGGYFQLNVDHGKEYYPHLIKLNTSRNALEYILIIKNYSKVYLPYFTCEVLLEPLIRLNIPYQFYHIDAQLEPVFDFDIGPRECFLYTNYFGLKQDTVDRLSRTVDHLIVDNAQAFFSEPLYGTDTFYSCRKFFGVPDGAYLQVNTSDRLTLNRDVSVDRFTHLLKSIDYGIENAYADFLENEKGLTDNAIKSMSLLTQSMLSGINYEECKSKRIQNFNFLKDNLMFVNEFDFEFPDDTAAMLYPLLISNKEVKAELIEKKIFVPTYWPNVLKWTQEDSLEYKLANKVVYLPVDHRYDLEDMAYMFDILKKIL